MIEEMVFWGATGQAKVLRECLTGSPFRLVAIFDNDPRRSSPFPDVPIHHGKDGFQAWLAARPNQAPPGFLVAIGGDRGRDRLELADYLQGFGLTPLQARHHTAFIAENADLGPGCQVLAQSAVCAEASLGRGSIVNTGATVDHDCKIGEGVHICPGAHLAGCVEVSRFSTIGTGAVVLPRIRIGEGATVGAGAVVLEDVLPGATVVGNPARPVRKARGR